MYNGTPHKKDDRTALDNSIFFIFLSLISFKFIGQVQSCEMCHKKLEENKNERYQLKKNGGDKKKRGKIKMYTGVRIHLRFSVLYIFCKQ